MRRCSSATRPCCSITPRSGYSRTPTAPRSRTLPTAGASDAWRGRVDREDRSRRDLDQDDGAAVRLRVLGRTAGCAWRGRGACDSGRARRRRRRLGSGGAGVLRRSGASRHRRAIPAGQYQVPSRRTGAGRARHVLSVRGGTGPGAGTGRVAFFRGGCAGRDDCRPSRLVAAQSRQAGLRLETRHGYDDRPHRRQGSRRRAASRRPRPSRCIATRPRRCSAGWRMASARASMPNAS